MDNKRIAEQIMRICGPGKLLIDAKEPAVRTELNRLGWQTSLLAQAEQTVAEEIQAIVCVHVLEELEGKALSAKLTDLQAIGARTVFCVIDQTEERDRTWWEQQFLQAGFRKHPLYQRITSFASLEDRSGPCSLVFERLPLPAFTWDALLESSRRADMRIACYMLAAQCVRPNDVVLDLACGAGEGAALLWEQTLASRVLGWDTAAQVVQHARSMYQADRPGLSYRQFDAEPEEEGLDGAVDLLFCSVPSQNGDLHESLATANRLVKPGGRLVLAGEALKSVVPISGWLFEQGYALQGVASPRSIVQTDPQAPNSFDGECQLWVLMKNPVSDLPYEETVYAMDQYADRTNIVDFARQYDRPWIQHALVGIGFRARSNRLMRQLANDFYKVSRPGSPDQGAALCVLGYQGLHSEGGLRERDRDVMAAIGRYLEFEPNKPADVRWAISNCYLLAQMHLHLGERAEARARFEQCANYSFLKFAPLIATKVVDACYHAGLLLFMEGSTPEARKWWKRGLQTVKQAFATDFEQIWGEDEHPLRFGADESADVFDLASRCVQSLRLTARANVRPQQVLEVFYENRLTKIRTLERRWIEQEAWIHELQQAKRWLEEQVGTLQAWAKELTEGKMWLEEQYENWKRTAQDRELELDSLREWTQELTDARNWLSEELTYWKDRVERLEKGRGK